MRYKCVEALVLARVVDYATRVMLNQIVASLNDDYRGIIHDYNVLIDQATT